MKIAIIYEDRSIFVEFNQQEFEEKLTAGLAQGLTVPQVMEKIIAELKAQTRFA